MYIKGDAKKITGQPRYFVVKKDLGANFDATTLAAELATYGIDYEPTFAFVENTNATGAAVRFYVRVNGAWKYLVMS